MEIVSEDKPTEYQQLDEIQVKKKPSLVERLKKEREARQFEADKKFSAENTKEQKFPFKWNWRLNKGKRTTANQQLCIFLNKKGEMEMPSVMPIVSNNLIIRNDTVYEFDPRAVWRVKGMKGNPTCYLIKEIDRRPVSNLDIDEIKKRGDSTDSDELLIKASHKAQQKAAVPMNYMMIGIVGILIVGGLIWWLSKS